MIIENPIKSKIYLVLLHYPIQNRKGELVTTSVTNMDLHDISRSAKTYGIQTFYIVTPLEEQHALLGRILSHWKRDKVRLAHPDRSEALDLIRLVVDFETVKNQIFEQEGTQPIVVLTDAKRLPQALTFDELSQQIKHANRPFVLVFGTGWGVSNAFYPEIDYALEPLWGPSGETGYNHLSVRAAAAIVLDRLFRKV